MTIFNETDILHHATKGKIDRIAATLSFEYPALALTPVRNESGDTVEGIALTWTDGTSDPQEIRRFDVKTVPDTGDLAGICEDEGLDPEAIEQEEQAGGSVVAEKYRQAYKENSSTGRSCGDWLAEWFAGETIGADGKTDMETCRVIFEQNQMDMTAKWATVTTGPGWQGRFRMNGRQVLAKRVAWSGFVIAADGSRVEVPAGPLETLRAKHARYIAKRQKQEDAAAAVAEAAAGA